MRDFISKRVRELQPSATVGLMSLVKQLKSEGQDIINLAGGEPNFKTPDRIIEQAYADMKAGFTSYVQSQGIPRLRQRIAEKLQKENHIAIDADTGIIVTASAKLALFIALFTCLQEGDEALYFEPAYVSYKPMIEMTGAKAVGIPLSYDDNYKITEEKILSCVTANTKLLLLCSPNNPTGRVYTAEELQSIVKVARKYDLLIFSDEIYERIIFDGNRHISPASMPEAADRVVTLNGFSKAFAMAGWRLGYVAAPPVLIREMAKVQQHILNCATSFVQSAAVTAFDCEDEVVAMTSEYARRRDYFVKALNEIPGITCRYPEGAFYVMVRIDYKGMDSLQLSEYILKQAKVAAAPGAAFGRGGEKCIRMPFATSMENLEKVVERLKRVLV